MENDELNILKSKIEKFMSARIPIHIALKNGRFLNGLITGKRSEDVYIIVERKIGKTYVLLEDIYEITVFTKDNKTLASEVINEVGFKIGEGVSDAEINVIKDINEDDESLFEGEADGTG